jgi:hypothetical protein
MLPEPALQRRFAHGERIAPVPGDVARQHHAGVQQEAR